MSRFRLTVEFQFEIGELVYLKGASHFPGSRPRQFVVVERVAQQCPGGVQLFYNLGGESGLFHEILLVREEPPYRPMCAEAFHEHLSKIGAEMEIRQRPWSEIVNRSEGGEKSPAEDELDDA